MSNPTHDPVMSAQLSPSSAGPLFATGDEPRPTNSPSITGGKIAGCDTLTLAGQVAAGTTELRYRQILEALSTGPKTCFEIARDIGVQKNQISGRFSELAAERLIERTGRRRNDPETSCAADVWTIASRPDLQQLSDREVGARISDQVTDAAGFPNRITLSAEPYDRQPATSEAQLDSPIREYTRAADKVGAGLALSVRLALLRCPLCGSPLRKSGELQRDGQPVKQYRCRTPECPTWEPILLPASGLLALVVRAA